MLQNCVTSNLLAIEIEETEIFMDKTVCLRLSILDLSKILMCEFWYNYLISKHRVKVRSRYNDTDSFIGYIKTDDTYKDIAEDAETKFDTLSYELDRPLPNGKNKKVIGLMKYELGKKIMAISLD